jgi:hypothetical protein
MKEEITNIIRTFKAVGPRLGNALKSGQLFSPRCELTEPDSDVLSGTVLYIMTRRYFTEDDL